MQEAFILALIATTSVVAYVVGRWRLGLSPGRLRPAAARLLECLGLAVLFLIGNQALGVAAILAARALTAGFVSLYLVDDTSVAVLSLLQALLFVWWRHTPAGR